MKKITTVAVYLLAGSLIAAMMLSAVSCELLDQGTDAPAPSLTETQTTVTSTTKSPSYEIIEPPIWHNAANLPYAMVRIIEKNAETVWFSADWVYTEYQTYKVEIVCAISELVKSWDIDTLCITAGSGDLKSGDTLIIEACAISVDGVKYYYPTESSEHKSVYVAFSDEGTINADEAMTIGTFGQLSMANYGVDEDKQFHGEMTVDDVIDFFTALEEAEADWQALKNSSDR